MTVLQTEIKSSNRSHLRRVIALASESKIIFQRLHEQTNDLLVIDDKFVQKQDIQFAGMDV
jgi:hypothetical protein